MGIEIISVEPYYPYDPKKQELSTKIDKHFSTYHKKRKLNAQSTLRANNKQGIRSEKYPAIKSSIFAAETISSDDLIPFIDIAMKLQQDAYEAAIATNRAYEPQLLFIFLEAFISIVFNLYYMISVIVDPEAFKLPMNETMAYLSQHLIQPIICILITVFSFTLVKHQFRNAQQIINKIIIHSKDEELTAKFLAFSQQTQTNIPKFSVFGFFELDGSVLFSMISATTTYLIILVQALGSKSEVDPFYSALESAMNESLIN